jgi:hypothetical protein
MNFMSRAMMLVTTVLACAACDRASSQTEESADASHATPSARPDTDAQQAPRAAATEAGATVTVAASASAVPAASAAPLDAGRAEGGGKGSPPAMPSR